MYTSIMVLCREATIEVIILPKVAVWCSVSATAPYLSHYVWKIKCFSSHHEFRSHKKTYGKVHALLIHWNGKETVQIGFSWMHFPPLITLSYSCCLDTVTPPQFAHPHACLFCSRNQASRFLLFLLSTCKYYGNGEGGKLWSQRKAFGFSSCRRFQTQSLMFPDRAGQNCCHVVQTRLNQVSQWFTAICTTNQHLEQQTQLFGLPKTNCYQDCKVGGSG